MTSHTLKDRAFFAQFKTVMSAAGFELVAHVETNSDVATYHVPATYARQNTFVYRLPNKQVFVRATLNESDGLGRASAYWSIHWDVEFKGWQAILAILPKKPVEDGYDRWDDDRWEPVPLMEQCTMPKAWHGYGSYYEQTDTYRPFNPDVVVDAIAGLILPAHDYIAEGMFDELQVTNWAPHYTFGKRGVAHFWRQFGMKRLFELAKKPRGSDVVDTEAKRRERECRRAEARAELYENCAVGDLIVRPIGSRLIRNPYPMLQTSSLALHREIDPSASRFVKQSRDGFVLCHARLCRETQPFPQVKYKIAHVNEVHGLTCVYVPKELWIGPSELSAMTRGRGDLVGFRVTALRETSVEAEPIYVSNITSAWHNMVTFGTLMVQTESGEERCFVLNSHKARECKVLPKKTATGA